MPKIDSRVRYGLNDCLTDCVAKFFGVHTSRVPLFVRYDNWEDRLRRFFRRRGYRLRFIRDFSPKVLRGRRVYLVQGRSPRNPKYRCGLFDHMVLYRGRRRYYDPSLDRRWLHGRPKHVWIPERIT